MAISELNGNTSPNERDHNIPQPTYRNRRGIPTEFGRALGKLQRRYSFHTQDLIGVGERPPTATQLNWLSRLSSRLTNFDIASPEYVGKIIQSTARAIYDRRSLQGFGPTPEILENIQTTLKVAAASDFDDIDKLPDALILAKKLAERTGISIPELAMLTEDSSLSNQALFDKWLGEKA